MKFNTKGINKMSQGQVHDETSSSEEEDSDSDSSDISCGDLIMLEHINDEENDSGKSYQSQQAACDIKLVIKKRNFESSEDNSPKIERAYQRAIFDSNDFRLAFKQIMQKHEENKEQFEASQKYDAFPQKAKNNKADSKSNHSFKLLMETSVEQQIDLSPPTGSEKVKDIDLDELGNHLDDMDEGAIAQLY